MIRTLITFVVILTGVLCTPAQDTTFMIHYDSIQNGKNGLLQDIEELTDGSYLLAGHQRSHDAFGRLHVFLRKIDSVGNVLHENEVYAGQDITYNMGLFDPLVRTDSGFAGVVSKYDQTVPYASALWFNQYDLNGDTVFTKPILEFTTADSTFVQHWQSSNTKDSGFICVGGIAENGATLADALIIRLNSIGDTIWTKKFGGIDQEHQFYSVREGLDGTIFCSGKLSDINVGPWNRHQLVKLDSLGNLIWRRQFGNRGGVWNSVRLCPDSTIATWSNYEDSTWPQVDVAAELRKWDQNGNLIWSTITHRTNGRTSTDFEVLPDGSFITVQEWGISMYLSKYSAMGDSLWSRWYRVFDGINAYGNIPYDVDIASDGGFLIAGEAEQGVGDPTNNLQTWYIIKTDSLGCVVPGCHTVGVQEYAIDLDKYLSIYPNPTSDVLNINFDLPTEKQINGTLQVVVLNALGREVFREDSNNKTFAPIDLNHLPSGTYHLHLTDNTTWLAGKTFVKE